MKRSFALAPSRRCATTVWNKKVMDGTHKLLASSGQSLESNYDFVPNSTRKALSRLDLGRNPNKDAPNGAS